MTSPSASLEDAVDRLAQVTIEGKTEASTPISWADRFRNLRQRYDSKEFVDLRSDYKKSVEGKKLEDYKRVMFKTWELLARQKGADPRIPALFRSKEVDQVLNTLFTRCFDLEIDPSNVGSGNNILLSGIRGIGKTTLMIGVCACIAVLSDAIWPIYHDCEQDGCVNLNTLVNQWSAKFGCPVGLNANIRDNIFQVFDEKRRCFFFCIDEINVLYVGGNHQHYERNSEIVRQLLIIGKAYRCFGMISGSSTNVVDLAFRKDNQYVDLNNTVYRNMRLHPVRSRDALAAFLQHQTDHVRGADVNEVFAHTGGVGRSITDYDDPEAIRCNRKSTIEGEFSNAQSAGREYIIIAVRLRSLNKIISDQKGQHADYPWKLQPISPNDFQAIFAVATNLSAPTASDPLSVPKVVPATVGKEVNRLIDNGLLYKDDYGNISFLCPCDLLLVDQLCQDNLDYRVMLGLITTLWGWDKGGSAGGYIESFVMQQFAESDHCPLKGAVVLDDNDKLSFSDENRPETEIWINELQIATFVKPAKDFGIDYVLFKPDGETCYLHLYQLKFGKLESKITAGGENSSEPDTVNGIRAKMERGIDKLVEYLSKLKLKVQCEIKDFTLITSKTLNSGARNVVESYNNKGDKKTKVNVLAEDEVLPMIPEIVKSILRNVKQKRISDSK